MVFSDESLKRRISKVRFYLIANLKQQRKEFLLSKWMSIVEV